MCKTKYIIDKMNYVSRCEPVYSKKSDILPNNYKVSLTTSRFRGLHFKSHEISLCCKKKFRCNPAFPLEFNWILEVNFHYYK